MKAHTREYFDLCIYLLIVSYSYLFGVVHYLHVIKYLYSLIKLV